MSPARTFGLLLVFALPGCDDSPGAADAVDASRIDGSFTPDAADPDAAVLGDVALIPDAAPDGPAPDGPLPDPDMAGPDGPPPDMAAPDMAPDAAGPECETHEDCEGDDLLCHPDGYCVQRCAPGRCGDGYCGAGGFCVDGQCDTDEVCPELTYCDETGRCVGGCRRTPDTCPEGQVCDNNRICVVDVECHPDEICGNGRDDDCDGEVDDPAICNAACIADLPCERLEPGICAAGTTRCPEVGGTRCDAAEVPADELCNGLDDDCDGDTDEGFGLGQPCEGGVGVCAGNGRMLCDRDGDPVCTYEGGGAELCDDLDNDCDGETDEDFDQVGAPCTVGDGTCAAQGRWGCGDEGVVVCDGAPGEPDDEACDRLDNDCDGFTDEAFPDLGDPCAVGLGVCARQGEVVCAAEGDRGRCDVLPGAPTAEACNGEDDDCDGFVDEGAAGEPLRAACYDGPEGTDQRGDCRGGRTTCVDGEWGACEGQIVPEPEVCDGVDNDCNGLADDDGDGQALVVDCYQGAGDTAGVGACREGTSLCRFGHLGPCVGQVVPGREICDRADNDCDGETDEVEGGCACEAGAQRECYTGPDGTAGTGACSTGVQTCAEDGASWGPCAGEAVPQGEACNGADDNCNAETDEGVPGVGLGCTDGLGACRAEGLLACRGDGVLCAFGDPGPGEPAPEVCDDVDNDCDGTTDEDFPINQACIRGVGTCSVEGLSRCNAFGEVRCAVVPGIPQAELCNQADDDCDGQVDEEFRVARPCTVGAGECRRAGLLVCDGEEGSTCNAQPEDPEAEQCDGVDNDCDGDTDEGFDVGAPCTRGVGACRTEGVTACTPDGGSECAAELLGGTAEVCNGADDDCDGEVDERLDDRRPCDTGDDGVCARGRLQCVEGARICVAVEAAADDELCDGLDNDCDGSVDEGFGVIQCGAGRCEREINRCTDGRFLACDPMAGAADFEICNGEDDDCDDRVDETPLEDGTPCGVGLGACRRTGLRSCQDGEVQCSAEPGEPTVEVCDWIDNDCDGVLDEGARGVGVECGVGRGACRGVAEQECVDGRLDCPAELAGDPVDELCDGLDNDCDGRLDEGLGSVVCGAGACHHAVPNCDGDGEVECDPLEGAAAEVCNGVDDDCDGDLDEDVEGLDEPCRAGQGVCARDGRTACRGGGTVCVAVLGRPEVEVCNLVDDDCDGDVDEEARDAERPCDAGVGACVRDGRTTCRGGRLTCGAVPGDPADEVCDGLDNDCDGETDEGFGSVTCGVGICRHTVQSCQAGGEPPQCDALEGQRPELCNGRDDDCDGATDEEAGDAGDACAAGLGACLREGVTVCGAGEVTCGAVPGDPALEVCDDEDNDCDGRTDEGDVCPDQTPPTVAIRLSGTVVNVGDRLVVTLVASDDRSGIREQFVTYDEVLVPLDGNGQAFVDIDAAGIHEVVATVRDGQGNQSVARASVRVLDPEDRTAPTARILSPEADVDLMERTPIVAEAGDDNLFEYRLEMAEKNGDEWILIDRGDTVPGDGVIGYFDPTLLENGLFKVRLSVEDVNGRITRDERVFVAEGEAKVGAFTITYTDVTVPVAGMPLTVERTYDSRVPFERDFGRGWTLTIKQGKFEHNRPVDQDWDLVRGGGFLRLPCQQTQEHELHTTELRVSDRERYVFHMQVNPAGAILGGCGFNVGYEYVHGTIPGAATLQILGDSDGLYLNGSSQLITWDFTEFEIRGVRLTTPDKRVFDFHYDRDGIFRVQDPNDNEVHIQRDGLRHSAGKSVAFERDRAGRITRATLPDGNDITYAYDQDGRLVAVTDELGNVTRYEYNGAHQLTRIIDPSGNTPARQLYDEDGRLEAIEYPGGQRVEMNHDPDNRTEVVRDRLGAIEVFVYNEAGDVVNHTDKAQNVTTNEYDEAGRLARRVEPGNAVTTYTYDEDGRMTRLDNPLGATRLAEYNDRNQTTRAVDFNGNVRLRAYDDAGNLTRATDPEGHVTAYTYDDRGNRTSVTDPEGGVQRFEYDDSGYVVRETNAAGEITTFTYDDNGNRLTQTRRRGEEAVVTRFEYDARNRVVRTIDPLGGDVRVTFDSRGRKSSETDKRGHRTVYEYDDLGNNTAVRFADGSVLGYEYDAEGRRVAVTDRSGNRTRVEYDALGRPVRTIMPDGGVVGRAFDGRGNLIRETDALGNERAHEYDAGDRRIRTTDALDRVTTYGYDDNGNRVATTGPDGVTTRFEYDRNDRLVATVFPDDTRTTTAYDGNGRKTSETDQAGRTTAYAYDAIGRLVRVTDAAGGVTRYTYDSLGNRTEEIDANGHVTRYEHDTLGRAIRRQLPEGEEMRASFDAMGNMTSRVDYNGARTDYVYDSNGLLTTIRLPDGTVETATHSPTGRRTSVTDARGVTRWTYDELDRVTSRVDPDGRLMRWAYDVQSNRTSVQSVAGATGYAYDALNRIVRVTAPDGGVSTYTYNAAGSRASLSQPGGLVTTYTYDAQRRLTEVATRRGEALVAGYAYTLGPAGNRTRVEALHAEHAVDYTYDALYRLTEEAALGGATIGYTYDAVGNRLRREHSEEGVTVYTYDDDDRIVDAGGVEYTHDDNGNVVGIGETEYAFDSRDRLVLVDDGESAVSFEYDIDGHRVGMLGEDDGEVRYVVDENRQFTEVLAETDANGAIQVSYVYGADLLSQHRGDQARAYLLDGQLSVRHLADANGEITDRYEYDAFGNVVSAEGETPNAMLYNAQFLDPNVGFYYLRARWLNPESGRFVSIDPASGLLFEPQTLHRYTYALNSPVDRSDPSGRFSMVSISISLSISSSLRSIYTVSLVRTFLTVTRIAICQLAPAYALRSAALDGISGNTPGAWEMLAASQTMIQEGFRAIGGALVATYERVADELIDFKVDIDLDLDATIDALQDQLGDNFDNFNQGVDDTQNILQRIQELQEWKDKVDGFFDSAVEWYDTTAALFNAGGNHTACERAKALEKVGNKLLDYVPSF